MSVLTLSYPEEFPEHAVCKSAFVSASANDSSHTSLRTTPSFHVVTMEDPGQAEQSLVSSLVAVKELAAAAEMPASVNGMTTNMPSNVATAPQSTYYTSEDGGQSEGASRTSARAAMLLATLDADDEDEVVVTVKKGVPAYRPCGGTPAYCC